MGLPPPNYDNEYDEMIADEVMAGAVVGEPDPIPNPTPKPTSPPKEESIKEEPSKVIEVAKLSSLKIKTSARQKRVVKDSKGKIKKRYIPIKMANRGSEVIYINSVINTSNLIAKDIIVKNPIPKNSKYVAKSAKCGRGCSISYSTDNGNSLNSSDEGRVNYIEFHFKEISPKQEVRMGFRVLVLVK
jgi:uncharacterized repeat protein (TIGR01451 family)